MKLLLLLTGLISFTSFAQERLEDQINLTQDQIDRFRAGIEERAQEQVVYSKEYNEWQKNFQAEVEESLIKFEDDMKHKVLGVLKPKIARYLKIYDDKNLSHPQKVNTLKSMYREIKNLAKFSQEEYNRSLKELFYSQLKAIFPQEVKVSSVLSNKKKQGSRRYYRTKFGLSFFDENGRIMYRSDITAGSDRRPILNRSKKIDNSCYISFSRDREHTKKINFTLSRSSYGGIHNFCENKYAAGYLFYFVSFQDAFQSLIKGCSVKICLELKKGELIFFMNSIENSLNRNISFDLPTLNGNDDEATWVRDSRDRNIQVYQIRINKLPLNVELYQEILSRVDYSDEVNNWPFSDNY